MTALGLARRQRLLLLPLLSGYTALTWIYRYGHAGAVYRSSKDYDTVRHALHWLVVEDGVCVMGRHGLHFLHVLVSLSVSGLNPPSEAAWIFMSLQDVDRSNVRL